ncbi:MAG: hypothetical protein IJY22_06520 [Clostridia bacterium]|nr:hypothetical protein [Clostridia bacterium]
MTVKRVLIGYTVARNLTEAAAIIDDITYDQSESCLALNEVVSHVDFSQFYLLFVHEEYQKEEHITRVTLEAMEQSENGTLVLYYPYTGEENVDVPYGIAYVRLILIRREGLDHPRESLTQSPHYYQIEEN